MTIYLRFHAGPRTSDLAPIFSIYDDRQREILLIGADRGDAVYRYRMKGTPIFDQPDVRLRGVMDELVRGDTARIVVWRRGRAFCMTAGHNQSCRLGFTLGRTWGLLLYGGGMGPIALRLLDTLWVALLFFPAGLWWRDRAAVSIKIVAGVLGVAIIPLATGVLHSSVFEYGGAILGILAGGLAGKTLARISELQGSASHNSRTQRSIRS